MFNINLLPKEILERRRYERWYRLVAIIGAGLIAIVLAGWALTLFEVGAKQEELQSSKDELQKYQKEAQDLEVFQESERKLKAREGVVQTALAGRVDMGQLANDISLVLPDEVWLDELTIEQEKGLLLTAVTPRNNGQSTEVAYKSVAKTLVRLGELPGLYDVWLGTAANDVWASFVSEAGSTEATGVPVVKFQTTAKVTMPTAGAATSASSTPVAAATGAVNAANSAAGGSSAGSTK